MVARQDDGQTCFLCEAYCPADALYVAPDADVAVAVDEAQLRRDGPIGSYRRALGWHPGGERTAAWDCSHELLAPAR